MKRASLCLSALWLVACAQILGLDDYSNARRSAATRHDAATADASASDAGTPFEPTPFLTGEKCSACIDRNCHAEDVACTADEFCATTIDETRKLEVPVIVAEALLATADDAHWAFDHGDTTNGWQTRLDFEGCAYNKCADDCGLQRDFSCVGKFDWPASYPKETDLRLRIVQTLNPHAGFDGWSIRACEPQTDCEHPIGAATTQDGGFATLPIDFSVTRSTLPEFTGFERADGGDAFFPTDYQLSRPFFQREYNVYRAQTRDAARAVATATGLTLDENQALVYFFPRDCLEARVVNIPWAYGVTIEVWKHDVNGFYPCAECGVAYPNDNGYPDATLRDFTPHHAGPAVALVPPGEIMVVMRDTKTGLPLSVVRSILVRAGYQHELRMYPASAEQLDSLPAEARTPPMQTP